jgi:hypothetical protein
MFPLEEYFIESAATKETATKSEMRDTAKKLYGSQQKFGLMSEKDSLCTLITSHAESTIHQLNAMPAAFTSPQDLYTYAVQAQSQTNQSLGLLKVPNVNNSFETKLSNASISSAPLNFSPPRKTALEHLNEDPLWAYKQDKMQLNAAVTQMGSAVVSVVKEVVSGFVEETRENIERFKREGFDSSNPRSLFYLKEKNDPS